MIFDPLHELAFAGRVKIPAIALEGLDAVFRARGLRSIADLMSKSRRPDKLAIAKGATASWRKGARRRQAYRRQTP
jgi:hypothetical protein